MKSDCPTGKQCYDSLPLAREGIIQVRASAGYRRGEGPEGIYQCHVCGCYHLTSGPNAEFRLEEEDYRRIEKEAQNRFWENKFRNKGPG